MTFKVGDKVLIIKSPCDPACSCSQKDWVGVRSGLITDLTRDGWVWIDNEILIGPTCLQLVGPKVLPLPG